MRRKARGRIVQALREVEHGLWLAWPELRSEIQSGVPGAESLDLDLLLDDLIMDGLVQDRLQDGTRRVALAE
jgi:hypothetical protein